MEETTKRLIIYLLCPLLVAAILAWSAWRTLQPDFLLRLSFYDVGQGDSAFVQTYQGSQVLIDGGPSGVVLEQLGLDLPFYDRTLDAVVLTHPHSDHASGLVDVLKRYRVGKLLMPEFADMDNPELVELIRIAEEKQTQIVFLRTGQRVWLDSATVFDVLSPEGVVAGATAGQAGVENKAANDGSLVGRLSFGKHRVLFEADAGASVESYLSDRYDVRSDILKVGHHGSLYSSSPGFLEKVRPAFAVIQVGKDNRYGHPAEEALNNLRGSGAEILRTDQDGPVRFVSDGNTLTKK